MEYTLDAASTSSLPDLVGANSDESSTGIPADDDLVLILPPHTSSLLQPLDTPTFGRWFDEPTFDRWLNHLHLSRTESKNTTDNAESEQTSDADSTSRLLDLANFSGDEPSDEDSDHLPLPIVNLDEVRFDLYQTS